MSLTLRSASTSVATTKGAALTHAEMDANWLHALQSANQGFVQSGSARTDETVQEKGRQFTHIDDYSGATDALKHASAVAAVTAGAKNFLFTRRYASDGMPNTENGAGWFRVSYEDPATTLPRSIDLSFYGSGSLFRFSGDGSTANNSRSVLEFWGQDQTGQANNYRPIMTLVSGTAVSEHEVHVARNPADTDAIIHSYVDGGTPAIFTESAQASALNIGVQRTTLMQINTTNLHLVSGHVLGWSDSSTNPGGTIGTTLTRVAVGELRLSGGDAEFLIGNSITGLSAAGYCGVRISGTTGGFIDLMDDTTRIGTIYNDATYAIALRSQSGTLPISFLNSAAAEQVRVTMTASATRYVTLTGSNGANPAISVSAGELAVGTNAWTFGVANVVSPTSPDRTLTVTIGATTYYIHAKTTNN